MTSEALLLQAMEQLEAGRPEAAEPLLRRLLAAPMESPDTVAMAAGQLARLCRGSGRQEEAIELLQGALLLAPENATLWADLASGLLEAGDAEASLACWQRCESLGGGGLEQRHDHTVALLQVGEAETARQRFEELLTLLPEHPRIRANLAHALEAVARRHYEADQGDRALEALNRALDLLGEAPAGTPAAPADPDHPEAELLAVLHDNAGIVLQNRGHLPEAITAHERALAFVPGRAESHFHLGLALLQTGASERGWHNYAWRFRSQPPASLCAALEPPGPEQEPSGSGPLLLVGEQGLGDMLQFLRYVQLTEALNPEVRLCLPEKLHGLARSSGIRCPLLSPAEAETIPNSPWLPLMSIPRHPALIGSPAPGGHPYLRIPGERLKHWRRHLRSGLPPGGRLVGVHWQGNPAVEGIQNRGRSFPLELLAPLARLAGVRLLSLQRGFGMEQRHSCSFREAFLDDQEELEAVLDFVEVGAMASACDLIISSDSALAHLCGGLGLPTWLLLRHVPDWRWGLEGEHTAWYPSLRLFRQSHAGQWQEPIERIAARLRARHDGRTG
jgi:tetratricopeptide (TPR) repeat protein